MMSISSAFRITNEQHRYGGDYNYQGTMTGTLTAAVNDGLNIIQTCLGSMKSYNRSKISVDDAKSAVMLINQHDLSLYTHTPFILNLASSDNRSKVVNSLNSELHEGSKVGLSSVVHIGAKGTIGDVHATLTQVQCGTRRNGRMRFPLLLENSAGEGTKLGKNIDELRKLFEPFEAKAGIGLCFDTCHAFAANMTDFSTLEVFDEIDAAIGLDRLQLIHLNDSMTECGSCKDRHEALGRGYIWTEKLEALDTLMNFCHEKQIDTCMETHNVLGDLALLRKRRLMC